MVMTKTEVVNWIAENQEIPKASAKVFLEDLINWAATKVKKEGQFKIPGLVQIDLRKRKARMGRNPATGEAIKIPAKTVLKARVPKALKDAVL